MLKVGIHENIVVSKAVKNDKGSLIVGFKKIEALNPLDVLNGSSAATSFAQPEQDFLIYPPKVENFNGGKKNLKEVLDSIGDVKDPLNSILLQYLPSDKIKWDMFFGTGITQENIESQITNQDSLNKIYNNIADQFIKMITPFLGDNGKKQRLLLIRQSKAKHFPKLRSKFLDSQPFIESMSIPASASKLKFSKYEIEQGLNIGEAISGEQTVSQEDKVQAKALFATAQ